VTPLHRCCGTHARSPGHHSHHVLSVLLLSCLMSPTVSCNCCLPTALRASLRAAIPWQIKLLTLFAGWGRWGQQAKALADSSVMSTSVGSSCHVVRLWHGGLQLGAPCSALPVGAGRLRQPAWWPASPWVCCMVLESPACRVVCRGASLVLRRREGHLKGGSDRGCGQTAGQGGQVWGAVLGSPCLYAPHGWAVTGHSWRRHAGCATTGLMRWLFGCSGVALSHLSNALTDTFFSVPLACFHLLESGLPVRSSSLLCMNLPHCASLLLHSGVRLPRAQLPQLGRGHRLRGVASQGDWCPCRDPLRWLHCERCNRCRQHCCW